MKVYIRNSFCCGFGKPIYRFENWLKHNGYEYEIQRAVGGSQASYDGRVAKITALTTVKDICISLNLRYGGAEGVPPSG